VDGGDGADVLPNIVVEELAGADELPKLLPELPNAGVEELPNESVLEEVDGTVEVP